jgi:hypothetical protein
MNTADAEERSAIQQRPSLLSYRVAPQPYAVIIHVVCGGHQVGQQCTRVSDKTAGGRPLLSV